jgi:hypothetical protein
MREKIRKKIEVFFFETLEKINKELKTSILNGAEKRGEN